VTSAGHRSLTRRDALTDKGAGHCLFIRYFLAAAKANGFVTFYRAALYVGLHCIDVIFKSHGAGFPARE